MASLPDLRARREKLVKAIDSGALTIRHGEKQVTYRSLNEMEKTLARLDDEIAALSGGKKRPKGRRIYTRRGL